jgi:hypothetical protein
MERSTDFFRFKVSKNPPLNYELSTRGTKRSSPTKFVGIPPPLIGLSALFSEQQNTKKGLNKPIQPLFEINPVKNPDNLVSITDARHS